MITGELKNKIDSLWTDFWTGGITNPLTVIEQITFLMYSRLLDMQERKDERRSTLTGKAFNRRFNDDEQDCRWETWRHYGAEDMLPHVRDRVFRHFRALAERSGSEASLFADFMKDAQLMIQKPSLLAKAVEAVHNLPLEQGDTKGDLYEYLLGKLTTAGINGQFRTPRHIIRLMVELMQPQPTDRICDPACGTGGFLACAFDHVKEHYVETSADHQTLQQQILGVEKKQLPHLLCTTNMLLHGIEVPVQIRHGNTLDKPLSSWDSDIDVILTNPPFGGTEEDGIEQNFPADLRTRETADLFLLLIIEVLKKGGRAAVVLPDGTLFGEGVKTKIKQLLTSECNLHTIVRLPNGVFAPYTGIKTNILFFTKGQPTKQIWFYEHPYPAGVKNYSKTKPMKFEEFEAEIAWWGDEADGFAARVENEQAWKVSIETIIERNFNLDIKNPHVGEQISHDPDELLARYATEQAEIQSLRDQLKVILGDALGKGAANQGGQA